MTDELDILQEPSIVVPQPVRGTPVVVAPSSRAFAGPVPNLAKTAVLISKALGSIYGEEIAARRKVSQDHAQNTGMSDEFQEALNDALTGHTVNAEGQIESKDEARIVDDLLEKFGVPRAADQVLALRSAGEDAALDAISPVEASINAGQFDSSGSGGTQAAQKALSEARSQLLESVPGTKALRVAALHTFDLRARAALSQASKQHTSALHQEAAQGFAGEVASGTADGTEPGLVSVPDQTPEVVVQTIQDMNSRLTHLAGMGHDPERVAIAGLQAAVDQQSSSMDKARILNAFITFGEIPGVGKIQRDDGTIGGDAAFQVSIAAIQDKIEEDEDLSFIREDRENQVRRGQLLRGLSDSATIAAEQAHTDGTDVRAAATASMDAFLQTEAGQRVTEDLRPDEILSMRSVAINDAFETVNDFTKASGIESEAADLAVMNALAVGDEEAARLITQNAPVSDRARLGRIIDGTDPDIVDALSAADEVMATVDPISKMANDLGDPDLFAQAEALRRAASDARTAVLSGKPPTPEEAKARLSERNRLIAADIAALAARARVVEFAAGRLSDAVGPLLLTNPEAARSIIAADRDAPQAMRAKLNRNVAEAKLRFQQEIDRVIAQAKADAEDLTEAFGVGSGLSPEQLIRASLTASQAAERGVRVAANELQERGTTIDRIRTDLMNQFAMIRDDAVREAIPLEEGDLKLTAAQFTAQIKTRDERAVAVARDGTPEGVEAAGTAIAAAVARSAGLAPGVVHPAGLDRLTGLVRETIQGQAGPEAVKTETLRYWLQARGDTEREAGSQALLMTGGVLIDDALVGHATASTRFASRDQAATSLRTFGSAGDLDQGEIEALAQATMDVQEGSPVRVKVGSFQAEVRFIGGFLGLGRDPQAIRGESTLLGGVEIVGMGDVVVTITGVAKGPAGALTALKSQFRGMAEVPGILAEAAKYGVDVPPGLAAGPSGLTASGLPASTPLRKYSDVKDKIAARKMSQERPKDVIKMLGLKNDATTQEIEAAILRAYDLGKAYR